MGSKASEETKEKMSKAMKEKLQDPELRAIYRTNAIKAQESVDKHQPSARKGKKLKIALCPICKQEVSRPEPGQYNKTCGSRECITALANIEGKLAHRMGKRSSRPCPSCGEQRKECYTSTGQFNKYQKTCGSPECIKEMRGNK